MKFSVRHWRQTGDTIVEVLIAMAVVSAVLTGAFMVTQQSVVAVRNGQERGEILQLMQGQIEHTRALALKALPSDPLFNGSNFCIDTSVSTNIHRVAASDAVCNDIQNRYDISISYNNSTHIFTFNGNWNTFGGGNGSLTMAYRVYPGGV